MPLIQLLLLSTLTFASDPPRPVATCPIPSLVVKHYLSDFPEFSQMPLITKPKEAVHVGDVLIVVLGKAPTEKKGAWEIMMGGQPHAMVVAEKAGIKGHLNSPSFFGNFVPDFEIGLSYVILRPKFSPELQTRFKTREAFESKMNSYLMWLEKVGIIYDPLMQTDILSPGYANSLRLKMETNCLKKSDVRPIYCSELAVTAAALIEIPYPEGKTIDGLFNEAIAFVKSDSTPETFNTNLTKAANEIIDTYLAEIRRHAQGLRDIIQLHDKKTGLIAKTLTSEGLKENKDRLKELEFQIAMFEAARSSVHQILKDKIEGKPPTPEFKKLLDSKVIRPHDYLAEAVTAGYEVIGLYAADIPPECLGPPKLAGDSPETH